MKPLLKPLAESLRPQILDEFFGQSHLLRDRHPLKQAIDNNMAVDDADFGDFKL
jgi:replication-associated recombination protein RarA